MSMPLLVMMGVALLLLGCWAIEPAKTSCSRYAWLWRWACLVCAVLLSIQPLVATLKWLGGLVGV